MIVLDASAAIELLLGTPRAEALAARLLEADERLHAPHLFDIEVTQALRRLAQLKQIETIRAQEALEAPLITCDAKLARSQGHGADIQLIS